MVKIVLGIELLGGRFLVHNGSDHFSLATNELKKMMVQRRLLRKVKGSKRVISGGGLGECTTIDEDKLILSSRGGRKSGEGSVDEDKNLSSLRVRLTLGEGSTDEDDLVLSSRGGWR